MKLENRLKALRRDAGWTQEDLALQVEVSRQSIHAIESGKVDPSLGLAFRIAQTFELPLEKVFQAILEE